MIFEKDYRISIKDVGASNLITNKGILTILEDAACSHSDIAGYGVNQIPTTHLSWFLLHWKVKIFKRLVYGSKISVKTWSRYSNKVFTLRDFEVYDENDNLVCIASSKWTLFDIQNSKITTITDDLIKSYLPEDKSVFEEKDIKKLKEPCIEEQPNYVFTPQRRDIDLNKHIHNLYYLDYAYETLPEEIYLKKESNNIEIMYKTGIKYGDTINCFYSSQEDGQYVVMKNSESHKLNAIIKLY